MELIFAYAAGLLTLINPCVLPILPIVLAGSLQAGRSGPVLMAAGMAVTFVLLGMVISVGGRALGIDEDMVSRAGAVLMMVFGVILLVPQMSGRFAAATAGFATRADARIDGLNSGTPWGQVGVGALMAAVWSPCIGPTLGAAIGLASQGERLGYVALIMTFFALGVATIILVLGYGARSVIMRRQASMRRFAEGSRGFLGLVFLILGLAIFFHWTRAVEAWAITNLPAWLVDLSVSL
jgi:cytochrome c biogenesis protein CcdA